MNVKIDSTIGISFLTPLVIQLEKPQPQPEPEFRAVFTFQLGDFIFRGENMSNTMQAGSYATLSIAWTDKYGNPAKVDGATSWVSSDETVATVEVATGRPDGAISNVHSLGPIGPVQIQATADADMGEGVKTITATCDISVISGEASGGEITFSQNSGQVPGGPGSGARGGGGKSKL